MRPKSATSRAPKERAISTSERSVPRTPAIVFTTMTKKENMNTVAATTVSRRPKSAMRTGTSADSGADMSAFTQPSRRWRTVANRPMPRPITTPRTAAGTKPRTSESRLEAPARHSVPSLTSRHHTAPMSEAGGTNIETCSRPTSSHTATSPATAARPALIAAS
jgi:hypothetical protein